MKKEKTVKTHTRKTKSGKTVTVKQHTAKYDAAEDAREIVKRAGAGKELEKIKKSKNDPYAEYGFTADEFAEWYEGTGSAADKKVEKALKKALGKKAYGELNDAAADNYKKGGAQGFFKKEVRIPKVKDSAEHGGASLKAGSTVTMGDAFSHGKRNKESVKVIATQSASKAEREQGISTVAWVQKKNGDVTLAFYSDDSGWSYDDTWSDFADPKRHPYAKSLKGTGFKIGKITNDKGEEYWNVTDFGGTSKEPKAKKEVYYVSYKGSDGKVHTESFTDRDSARDFEANVNPILRSFHSVRNPEDKGKSSKATSKKEISAVKTDPKDKAMSEYKTYRKEMDAKKKSGKRLTPAETTKLKKLAKAAGVGRTYDEVDAMTKKVHTQFSKKYPHISIGENVVKNYLKKVKKGSKPNLDHLADYVLSQGLGEVQE